MWMHGDAASLYRNAQIIDVRPYFESVNPYTGELWQDSWNLGWFPNQVLTAESDLNYGVGPIPYVDDALSEYSRNQAMKYALGVGAPNVLVTKKAADEGRAEAAVDFLRFWSDPSAGAEYFVKNLCSCLWSRPPSRA
jgi:ABC-type glycerol-3-phosphate transport system substrate-binding protein